MNRSLFALALAAFGIGTTEFVIMGLLPEVAADLRISIPRAGLLVSGYALGVALGGPLLALVTINLPRKGTLAGLMGFFVVGNLGCALAPDYSWLMVARVVTAFCHAAFFGIGAVVAANLVAPEKRAQAMAMMFSGLTLANVMGVPLGTWIGQAAGWRATFWAVTAFGVVALLAVVRWLPRQRRETSTGLGAEMSALRSANVWIALVTSVLASTSMFTLFTYIAPFLREVTGVAAGQVGGVLLLCGIGITIGNLVGARLADWRLMPSLAGIFFALILILMGFAVGGSSAWTAVPVLCLWGLASFAACTALQARVVEQARDGANLASTLNISAFNLGNALGAGLGGAVLEHGTPLRGLPWVAVLPAAVALTLTVIGWWRGRSARSLNAAVPATG